MSTGAAPIVSVVIPTYNRARYVGDAITSVLSQVYQNYELIVVDDGSTDNTRSVLEPYFSRIQYIYQENHGVSVATNVGVQHAKADWVSFLDSDDEWHPEKLALQMSAISDSPDVCLHTSNARMVGFLPTGNDTDLFALTGLQITNDITRVDRPLNLRYQIRYGFARLPCMVVRKDVLLRAGLFDPALTIYQDQDLLCRLALEGSWGVTEKQLVRIYRREEDKANLSRQSSDKPILSQKALVYLYGKLRESEKLDGGEREIVEAALSASEAALGMEFLKAKQILQARLIFRNSLTKRFSWRHRVRYLLSFLPASVAAPIVCAWHRIRGLPIFSGSVKRLEDT